MPKQVFQRRQRADPAGCLHERRPQDSRDMEPGQPPAAQNEKTPEYGEKNESCMCKDNDIGKDPVNHY
jgi:hypothetical protein